MEQKPNLIVLIRGRIINVREISLFESDYYLGVVVN